MAAAADLESMRARLKALRSAAALHPLSLACVQIADAIVRDLASEVAEDALREATPRVPCSEELRDLLEGSSSTLPEDGARISSSLHRLLVDELAQSTKCSQRMQRALAPSTEAGQGADIFGNRQSKKQADAETIACTNCGQALSANRFAPHLERCFLGKGRKRTRPQSSSQ
jgi:hypothetical protein